MRKQLALLVLQVFIVAVLIACSCAIPTMLASTPAPSAPAPTATPVNAHPAPPGCDRLTTLDAARALVPYDEFAANYYYAQGHGMSLAIWFVNPALTGQGGSLGDRVALGTQAARDLVVALLKQVPCVHQAFDFVETVEVDSSYNGWLSIAYGNLDTTNLDEEVRYQITAEPEALGNVPAGACSWQAARAEAESISVPDSNRAVYLVRDRSGTHVYVYWSRPDDLQMDESLYFMAIGLDMPLRFGCLFPPADELWMYMEDTDGNILRSQQFTAAQLQP